MYVGHRRSVWNSFIEGFNEKTHVFSRGVQSELAQVGSNSLKVKVCLGCEFEAAHALQLLRLVGFGSESHATHSTVPEPGVLGTGRGSNAAAPQEESGE